MGQGFARKTFQAAGERISWLSGHWVTLAEGSEACAAVGTRHHWNGHAAAAGMFLVASAVKSRTRREDKMFTGIVQGTYEVGI